MRVITKITTQKKRNDRYNIFLDGEYAFAVDEQVLITYELKKGVKLSAETIEKIIHAEDFHKTYALAVRYLGYRMRSIQEIETYLTRKEIGQLEIEKVISRLITEGFLNDEQFANAFVRDRMIQTTKGPVVIKRELAQKGINDTLATKAVKQYTYEEQYEIALAWAKKENNRTNRHSFRKKRDQLKIKLMQKGFDNNIVSDILQALPNDIDESEERRTLTYHGDRLFRRHSRKFTGYELKAKIKTGLYTRGFAMDLIDEYVEKVVKED